MKALKRIILIFICFILCACTVRNESTLTINEDGKLKYEVLIAFDKELIESLKKNNIIKSDEEIDEYVNNNIKDNYLNGFIKQEYSDEEYVGNTYTYEVNNIDDVSTTSNVAVILNKNSVVEKNMFTIKNGVYKANFSYNLKNKYNYENVDFINTFTVNLPRKAISSNADEVLNDGKTLVWNIKNGESKAINFKFSFTNENSHIYLGFIIFDVVLVLGIGAFYFIRKFR